MKTIIKRTTKEIKKTNLLQYPADENLEWIPVEVCLKKLKSIQAEWKFPSKEGTFTDPRMMIDSLIEELESGQDE